MEYHIRMGMGVPAGRLEATYERCVVDKLRHFQKMVTEIKAAWPDVSLDEIYVVRLRTLEARATQIRGVEAIKLLRVRYLRG